MLNIARLVHPSKKFHIGNSESWGEDGQFDVATCMFAFHEMPEHGRRRVLQNMLRVAPTAIIADIHPSYVPGERMLVGEPYLLEYLDNIEDNVATIAKKMNATATFWSMVPDRVALWKCESNWADDLEARHV